MILVVSTSLSSDSRSRILADFAFRELQQRQVASQWFDLNENRLPACDAGQSYSDPHVVQLTQLIESASGILIAGPIYNYDMGSAAKNMIELTGKAWTEKVVGLMCAAGGQGSYMAPMQLANSLMLDFRSLILPRFVYATGDQFQGHEISDTQIEARIVELIDQMLRISAAVEINQS